MGRKILFRGKRVDNGEWVCGYLYRLSERLNPFIMFVNSNAESHEVILETVGQFTGSLDDSGNKIFEGDIVKVTYTEQRQYQGVSYRDEHSCVEEVIYNEKSACFMLKIMCEDIPLYRPLHNFGCLVNIKELEVIGNKWDNPELLEVEQ